MGKCYTPTPHSYPLKGSLLVPLTHLFTDLFYLLLLLAFYK